MTAYSWLLLPCSAAPQQVVVPLVANRLQSGQFWVRSTTLVHGRLCGSCGRSAPSLSRTFVVISAVSSSPQKASKSKSVDCEQKEFDITASSSSSTHSKTSTISTSCLHLLPSPSRGKAKVQGFKVCLYFSELRVAGTHWGDISNLAVAFDLLLQLHALKIRYMDIKQNVRQFTIASPFCPITAQCKSTFTL